MKLFVDTGHVGDIEKLAALGILDGVTTNPSLMAKEGGDPRAILARICDIVRGPVSAEVVATDAEGMVREGRDLAGISEHIVVKVPFTPAGVQACGTLAGEGLRVNVTLIFSTAQAWLAAKVGATYVSPFVGRLDDIATPGMQLIREITDVFRPRADTRGGGRAHGRRRGDVPAQGHRAVLQAPAHRHRARAVPRRLGEGAGHEGLAPEANQP